MAKFVGIEDMVADPACWIKQGFSEESVESVFSRHFIMHRGRNDRVTGWYALHNYLTTKMADGLPLMQIFSGCEDTIRTLPMMTVSKTNPEDIDTRTEDHACFTGDTLIDTKAGRFPIKELVGTTGYIDTIDGYRMYHSCRKTRVKAEVYELTFSDGSIIKCTGDHKFMLWDGSWCEALDLRDKILYTKQWNNINIESTAGTKRFGKPLMDLFRKGLLFITKTMTRLTMFLRTSFLWRTKNTGDTTEAITRKNIWKRFNLQGRKRQESGMEVKKGKNGTKNNIINIVRQVLQRRLKRNASSVESLFKASVTTSSAPTSVSLSGEERLDSMMSKEYVTPAGKSLSSISIVGPKHAQGNVQMLSLVNLERVSPEDVYCMTVAEIHSFVLNQSFVVSNCDEIRYATLFIKNKIHAVPTWEPKNDSYSLLRRKIGGNGRRSR